MTSRSSVAMKWASVVKWGALSAAKAMNRTFSRQRRAISRLDVTPRA